MFLCANSFDFYQLKALFIGLSSYLKTRTAG